jgi:hypothetical protein
MRLLSEANPRPELEIRPRLEISGGWAIKNVWYLPAERGVANPALPTYNDVGVLHIGDDAVVFDGERQIVIENPRLVTYSRQGSNLINNWVKVVYGSGETPEVALFADGRFGGWGGLLGGTKRIFEAIEPLVLETPLD